MKEIESIPAEAKNQEKTTGGASEYYPCFPS